MVRTASHLFVAFGQNDDLGQNETRALKYFRLYRVLF